MDSSVREHLNDLEQKLVELNARLMNEPSLEKRNELETELRAVQSAATLYYSAKLRAVYPAPRHSGIPDAIPAQLDQDEQLWKYPACCINCGIFCFGKRLHRCIPTSNLQASD
jgi:hypothetical protein